jgi:hypothetical protein
MVVLWVNGKAVATLTEAEVLPLLRCTERVQLRSEDGRPLGEFLPPTPAEPLVPWDPSITEEEIQRRKAGPMLTTDELKQRLGWT